MKVIVITELRHDKNFQLQPLHEIAQFSRSTYYYILKNLVKPDKYKVTIELIMKIFKEHKRRYGYSRITKTLRTEYNCFINNKTVRRLMKELGIASRIRIKKYRSCRGIVGNIAKNLLKRVEGSIGSVDNVIQIDGIKINRNKYSVSVDGLEKDLAPKEFELLWYLMENNGIALSRDKILNNVWGYDYFGEDRVVDTHIKKIRKKMEDKASYIKTVVKYGYKFEVKHEK